MSDATRGPLARYGEISFPRFKEQLKLTDDNLDAQLRRLEDEGYIAFFDSQS